MHFTEVEFAYELAGSHHRQFVGTQREAVYQGDADHGVRHPGVSSGGMTEDEILSDFPDLTREDIRASLAFAAARERRLANSVA